MKNMFKYKTYLNNGHKYIEHVILTKKSEFNSKFNHFWSVWISTLIALPYFVIAILLYLVYRYSTITIIEVICMVAMFLMIPLALLALDNIKSTIEDYIFDEFIFPQIEQEYIKNESENLEDS